MTMQVDLPVTNKHLFYEGQVEASPYLSTHHLYPALHIPSSTRLPSPSLPRPDDRPAPRRSLRIPFRRAGSVFTFLQPRPRPRRSNCWLPRSLLASEEAGLRGEDRVVGSRGKGEQDGGLKGQDGMSRETGYDRDLRKRGRAIVSTRKGEPTTSKVKVSTAAAASYCCRGSRRWRVVGG